MDPQLGNATAYRLNITHKTGFQPFDTREDDAAYGFILQFLKPFGKLW